MVPKFSRTPQAIDAAMLSAARAVGVGRRSSRHSAAVAPIVPSMEVGCHAGVSSLSICRPSWPSTSTPTR